MPDLFSKKLAFVLKALSTSRARLAADIGVDKSVVARWASGATTPSAHNLSQLTLVMAKALPGFTVLDWDRDVGGLADLFGIRPRDADAAPPTDTPGLTLPFMDQIKATTALRGSAYEGFYQSTRPYAGHPGRYLHDQCLVRRTDDGLLRLKMVTGGVQVDGWVLPVQNQLFVIGTEFTSGGLVFAILHGINGRHAGTLDGLTMSSSLDVGRTPAATPLVLHWVGELSQDAEADEARVVELGAGPPVAPEGSVPEALMRHLSRDIGPAQAALGGDWMLRLPLAMSISNGREPLLR